MAQLDRVPAIIGDSEMARLMRTVDWSATSLGDVGSWPEALRTALGICLDSRFPILLWWGQDLAMLYNDAYSLILDDKHPAALGQRGRECWPEIWDVIGPMLDGVLRDGRATWSEDQVLFLERRGFPEECYFTFSYSPIRDGDSIGGIFTAVTETTDRVIRERRLATIRALTAGPRRTDEAIAISIRALRAATLDIPFAILFVDGLDLDRPAATSGVDVASVTARPDWLAALPDEGTRLADLSGVVSVAPPSAWGDPTRDAFAIPLRGGDGPRLGTLVLGLSPRLGFDEEYLGFLRVVAGRVASALSDAHAHESERQRAEELAALDRAKTTFFTNVSHELRTPLTLLLGPLGRLANDEKLTEGGRADVEMALRNARRLHRLVNTLLDFSKIEAGRSQATYRRVDLGRFTADIASMFDSAFQRGGVELRIGVSTLPDDVFVDPAMWEKVVVNLLSNALKYTLEGTVELELTDADGMAELRVADSGVGIATADLPRLFDRFVRLEHPSARSNEGTGIGLALTAELVRLHGGTIEATSEPGRGTTFVVRLPYGSAHLPAERVRPAEDPGRDGIAAAALEEALGWVAEKVVAEVAASEVAASEVAASEVSPVPQAEPDVLRGARILVADDNADMRRYISTLLVGAVIEEARNGEEALALIAVRRPDVVIADVMMPGLDGFGLLERIRSDPATARVPVMLVSARAGEEASVDGLRAGADDYLVKPFSAMELAGRVAARIVATRERDRAEATLREAERRWHAVTEQSPAFVALLAADGRAISVSRAWREFLGTDVGPSLADAPVDMIHPDDRAAFDARRVASVASGEAFTGEAVRVRGADGTYRWFEMLVAPVLGESGKPAMWVSVSHDVHDRKVAQDALAALHAELEAQVALLDTVIETSPVGVGIWDSEGRCVRVNERLAAMSRVSVREQLGRTPAEYDADAWPSYREPFLAALRGEPSLGRELARQDGAGGISTIMASYYPLRAPNGDVSGVAAAWVDATDDRRREAELREALEAKDEFLGLVSHELRTPLTTIVGAAQVLARRTGTFDAAARDDLLADLVADADRLSRIVENLLTLSRLSRGVAPDLEPVLLGPTVERITGTHRRLLPRRAIAFKRSPGLPMVLGREGYIEQIVGNLISNADKYSPPDTPIEIDCTATPDEVVVAVADRGVGIDPAEATRLFDPFYRSKRTESKAGIGIGLAVCHRLAEAQAGRVWAEPRDGGGSTFYFALPIEEAAAA